MSPEEAEVRRIMKEGTWHTTTPEWFPAWVLAQEWKPARYKGWQATGEDGTTYTMDLYEHERDVVYVYRRKGDWGQGLLWVEVSMDDLLA